MEQLFAWASAGMHVFLAALFAMAPGTIVWLVVLSVILAIRWVSRSGPLQRLRHGAIPKA